MTTNGPHIKDIIIKEFELTEAYHDQKAHSAWIASTVYFAFSIGFLRFWQHVSEPLTNIMITVLCSAVFTGAMSFISLQFRHRWDSVIRSGMFTQLFEERWKDIKTEKNYKNFKKYFKGQEKKNAYLGITKERRVVDIFLMTPILPIILIVNFFFMLGAKQKKKIERIEKKIKVIEKKIKKMKSNDIKKLTCCQRRLYCGQRHLYRKKRRHKNGLIDTRYRTEIPAYTISLYFFVTQLLLIWVPKFLSLFQQAKLVKIVE